MSFKAFYKVLGAGRLPVVSTAQDGKAGPQKCQKQAPCQPICQASLRINSHGPTYLPPGEDVRTKVMNQYKLDHSYEITGPSDQSRNVKQDVAKAKNQMLDSSS